MRTSGSQGLDKNFFYYKTAPEVYSEINLYIDLFTSDPGKAIMLDLNLIKLNLFLVYKELLQSARRVTMNQSCYQRRKLDHHEHN